MLVALFAVVLSLTALATPANAHTTTYCGHGVHWDDWNTRTEYVRHWTDSYGRPRHTVYIRDGLLTAYSATPVCSHRH